MIYPLTARCLDEIGCPFKAGKFCERDGCAVEDDGLCLPSATAHEKNLRGLDCLISGSRPVTLHHCRGGSMASNPFGTPGAGQKQNHALQIPIAALYHVGALGIDARIGRSAPMWEEAFGHQVTHLSSLSALLRYSPWALAWRWTSPLVAGRVERFLRASRSRFHQQ